MVVLRLILSVKNFTLMNNQVFLTSQEAMLMRLLLKWLLSVQVDLVLKWVWKAHLALSEPLMSTSNFGFVREDANLSLIFLSDEDDFSPKSTHDICNSIRKSKERGISRSLKNAFLL